MKLFVIQSQQPRYCTKFVLGDTSYLVASDLTILWEIDWANSVVESSWSIAIDILDLAFRYNQSQLFLSRN